MEFNYTAERSKFKSWLDRLVQKKLFFFTPVISEIWLTYSNFTSKEITIMKFNYEEEKRKFDSAWEKTARLYAEQGMPQEAIDAMHEFDWDTFKAERIWALHTQEMPATADADEESGIAESPMVKRYFDRFTTEYDTYGVHSRFWWFEEISDPRIARVLCKLSDLDKTLLTMVWIEGYTQADCAVILHMDRGAISMRFHRILSKIAKNAHL